MILAAPPEVPEIAAPAHPDLTPAVGWSADALPWVLSAKSADGLAAQAARLAEHMASHPRSGCNADVGYSLITTRPDFDHRAVVVGASRDELVAGLADLAGGRPNTGVVSGQARRVGKTVLVFPGQGSGVFPMNESSWF